MENKNIAVIGGGHGTSVVLKSLSGSGAHLSGILSMADDGGSTGRLREDLGVSAVGDIRQCLVALSSRPEIADLFSYRFESGSLKGHSLGNLFLGAGEKRTGSLARSIELAREALGVNSEILPSTDDNCHLFLDLGNKRVKGVYAIANTDFAGSKPELSLEPAAKINEQAKKALEKADLIIIAPGNFYCSIIPALLVDGMAEIINNTKAKTILISNLVNRAGHTDDFKVTDYIKEIIRLSGVRPDGVIYNTADISEDCLRPGEAAVGVGAETDNKFLGRDIADSQKVQANDKDKIAAVRSLVRHDPAKLENAIKEIASMF